MFASGYSHAIFFVPSVGSCIAYSYLYRHDWLIVLQKMFSVSIDVNLLRQPSYGVDLSKLPE